MRVHVTLSKRQLIIKNETQTESQYFRVNYPYKIIHIDN